jgi:hypothetical protein
MRDIGLVALMLLLFCACGGKDENTIEPDSATGGITQIRINEFLASNQYFLPDPDGQDEYDDWIEIYNAGDKAVDIGGLYITDNRSNRTRYRIPTTHPEKTTILPRGYLILWADSQLDQGALHVDFKLSSDGEDIGIYDEQGRVIDETTYPAQVPDVSTGRSLRDPNVWISFSVPTPGKVNQ